jgi:phosphoribosylglycinamide formyltransferase 1
VTSASPAGQPRDVVVLVSGSGTNLQALIDAASDPAYGVRIVAVGADRPGTEGIARAQRAGIPTFLCRVEDYPSRAEWDTVLTAEVAGYEPWMVVSAGFMKIVGEAFIEAFSGRFLNTHPALLPSFPGAHAVRDALAHGAKVSGATCHLVDAGVDTGPIIAQTAVEVRDDDTVESLHERIKTAEHAMLVDCVGRMAREGFTVTNRKVTIP